MNPKTRNFFLASLRLFWGLRSKLRRYVSQLAARSALRRKAPRSGLRPLLHIASPAALGACKTVYWTKGSGPAISREAAPGLAL